MNQHTLKDRGAAFDPETSERVDTTGLGGVGSALCSCGWLSDPLPSGKQRMLAHREHKATAEAEGDEQPIVGDVWVAEEKTAADEEPLTEEDARNLADNWENQTDPGAPNWEEPTEEPKPIPLADDSWGPEYNAPKEDEQVDPTYVDDVDQIIDAQQASEPGDPSWEVSARADFYYTGIYAGALSGLAQTLAASYGGLEVTASSAGNRRRSVTVAGDPAAVEEFTPLLKSAQEQAEGALKTWNAGRGDIRKSQGTEENFIDSRSFLEGWADQFAKDLRNERGTQLPKTDPPTRRGAQRKTSEASYKAGRTAVSA